MNELHTILQEAVTAGDIPFVVAMVGDSSAVTWSGAAGERISGVPAAEDTVFRLFSMTKGIGSVAAMILIDRGELSLETPVEAILPQFAEMKVLEGFDGDAPRLRSPRKKPNIRHLATQTSGCAYALWNSEISKYLDVMELPGLFSGMKEALNTPLAVDPGVCWVYGTSTDWLGLVVEAIDGRSINTFCREEIFKPLGMPDTVFELTEDIAKRLAPVKMRDEEGRFVEVNVSPPSDPEFYGMGHALYSTAPDYMRFLRMLLNRGQLEGERILSEAGIELMLANHLGGLRVGALETTDPPFSSDLEFFPEYEKSHSLAFMRMEEDIPDMRTAGSQFWAGVCNTHFWFDPARDLAGILLTQSLPFLETRFMQFFERFERAVYANSTLSQ
jgi:methyl acetate hydrolase